MTEPKLKRCPNPECGGWNIGLDSSFCESDFWVHCDSCECIGPTKGSKQEAIRLWNLISERVWDEAEIRSEKNPYMDGYIKALGGSDDTDSNK